MQLVDSNTIGTALAITARAVRQRAQRESWKFSEKKAIGGIRQVFAIEDLPSEVQAKVALHLLQTGKIQATESQKPTPKATKRPASCYDRESLWAWYDSRPQTIKDEGTRRAGYCLKVRALIDSGLKVRPALAEVARVEGISLASLKRWWYGDTLILGAANVDRTDYAAALAPRYAGGQDYADFTPDAWEWIKADWLRPEQPSTAAVYRRAQIVAKEKGWTMPSLATVKRRLEDLPWQVRVLAREGEEALKRMLPHVTRNKSTLHALETVNADGHIFDLRVKLPSGEVGRPVFVVWQDIYSGKILSYRLGETLNQHIVRLAFGEVVEKYGVPEHCFLDNGREFANKWLTGGAKTRFRFTIREEDPIGIFTQLGINIHWTTPYHGQSKPIERAFRDLCEGISKHPAASGAYTGNSPTNKPSNYGARVLEWSEFQVIVEQGIAEHNARTGRRSQVANGRSFDQTFAESYAISMIRKATPEQRRLWLLAAEGVTVRQTGHVAILNNLYWSESVAGLAGRKVVVRFDSDNLELPVHVYDLAGEYLGEASCTQANFLDAQAAKDHARANRQKIKAAKAQLEAERKMDAIEAAQALPNIVVPMERPTTNVIVPLFEKTQKVANGSDDGLRSDDHYILDMLSRMPRRTEEDF